MSLSILCVTNNEPAFAYPFIMAFRKLADRLGAELVLDLNRDKADTSPFRGIADKEIETKPDTLQDLVLDMAIGECSGDYVLRMDNDESVSPALADWLATSDYQNAELFTFPRVYFWGDTSHYLNNPGMFPDLQTRLGRKELMTGCTSIHAGNPNGPGMVIPLALEHHNLLVKDLAKRREIAALYESISPGAGSKPEYARYNLPEDFYPEFELMEYTNRGDFR
jgi:hypothetical protein